MSEWQSGVLGKDLTSIKIGGPIRWVSRPHTKEELEADCQNAKAENLPCWVLGAGSNLILPDEGFDGLLIIPANKATEGVDGAFEEAPYTEAMARYSKERGMELPHHEVEAGEPAWFRLGAGVPWGQAVSWTLNQQAVGLHWYARIPCTVGGAAYNNIHGENHFVSEVIQEVTSFSMEHGWRTWKPSELGFAYDYSTFHAHKNDIIWDVTFKLEHVSKESAEAARTQYIAWTKAKVSAQPAGANCGSVFQNLEPSQVGPGKPLGAGWYIEEAGCKGWREGDMEVSPTHANFMSNLGNGTQGQVIALMQRVRQAVRDKFGVLLVPEVEVRQANGETYAW